MATDMDIYKFKSYRQFVKEMMKASKKSSHPLTLASVSKKMTITAPALQMILAGKRDLTADNIHKLASAIRLSGAEVDYFEKLVRFEQSKDSKTKAYYSLQLKSLNQSEVTTAKTSNQDLLSQWYMPVLLVYLMDEAYRPKTNELLIDYPKIKKHLGLHEQAAKAYLHRLQELGVLEFRKKGQVHVVFEKVSSYFSQRQYLKRVLSVMPNLLDQHFDERTGFFEASTFSMDPERLENFRKDYKALVSRYLEADEESKNSKMIFQTFNCIAPVM